MSKELKQAINYYANAYVSMVVGTSMEEGISAAEYSPEAAYEMEMEDAMGKS